MPSQGPDALVLIFSAAGACISFLAGVVVALLNARLGRHESKTKDLESLFNGPQGAIAKLENLHTRLEAVEKIQTLIPTERLSVTAFNQATQDQNRRLDELKAETQKLAETITKTRESVLAAGRHLTPMARGYSIPPPEKKR